MREIPMIPVVLAGGSGTRLWPLSRRLYPKQLLSLNTPRTMLQETVLRLKGLPNLVNPIVICNQAHRFMVEEQLQEAGIRAGRILLEPVGRNTAPAIAICALEALKHHDEAFLLILPADHFITEPESFRDLVRKGLHDAEDGHLITFGILPDNPETGYGYIRKGKALPSGAFRIGRFVEKPSLDLAREYLASGEYFWNSGMFLFRASAVLEELRRFVPDILSACEKALEKARTDMNFVLLDPKAFESSPSDSIDYAVMEKTEKGAVLGLDTGWSDLGSWEALWQVNEKNEDANVTKGDVFTWDVKNSYLHAESRMLAAIGLENHIVVETSDAVLVAPRDRVQEVKRVVDHMHREKREEAVSHRRVYRPWGSYETVAQGDRFQVKRITVKPGGILSSQMHFHRAEHWVVVHGTAVVWKDEEKVLLREDESIYIPLGTKHRLENPGKIPLELIEVQSGAYLGEDDIVRYDDVYGRAGGGKKEEGDA